MEISLVTRRNWTSAWVAIVLIVSSACSQEPSRLPSIPGTEDTKELDREPPEALPMVFPDAPTDEVTRFRSAFGQAWAEARAGRCENGLPRLEKLRPREALARAYVHVIEARCHAELKKPRDADAIYSLALRLPLDDTWRGFFWESRLALYPAAHGGVEERLAFLEAFVQQPVSASGKFESYLEMLRLKGFHGKVAGFEDLLVSLFELKHSDPRRDSLYRVTARSVEPGTGDLDWELVLLELEKRQGDRGAALSRLAMLETRDLESAQRRKLDDIRPGLLYSARRYAEALTAYQERIDRYGRDADAVYQIARIHDKLGHAALAKDWYENYTQWYPKSSRNAGVTWVQAWNTESEGHYNSAINLYRRVLHRYPWYDKAEWANFRIGLCHYKAGRFTQARAAFRDAERQSNAGSIYPAALYWSGKASLRLRDTVEAKSALGRTWREYPLDFYGHLALRESRSRSWVPSGLDLDSLLFTPSHTDSIKYWMQAGMSAFSEDLGWAQQSAYLDIPALLRFGLDTLALNTFDGVLSVHRKNPWFLFNYAGLFQRHGLEVESYRLARRLSWNYYGIPWPRVPKEVVRLAYPRPFGDLVMWNATLKDLDPDFIYALMKQESAFDPGILSVAGAVGLMQIIPPTGEFLARQENLDGFHPSMLADPRVNIRLGTTYLRDLKTQYEGQLPYILANYNAGPGPARRWQKAHGQKELEFIAEEISYSETRNYVKKVLGNFWTYQLLWEPKRNLSASG